jgi:hypothetical protein
VAVATQLAEDDELATSLACRKLREAIVGTERRRAGARLSTSIGSALGSVGKLEWAASCGMPLSAKLLTCAARLGQLEHLRWLRAHGCAWSPPPALRRVRARARLRAAIYPCCSGHARMAVRGTGGRARTQLGVGTWPCFSRLAPMAARGMRGLAVVQPKVGTWPCCSGLVRMTAPGMRSRAVVQPKEGTWPCCNGFMRMAARGMRARADGQPKVGIWPCCSGLVPMTAPGMRTRAVGQPNVDTWPCCSGLVRMAVPGMRGWLCIQLYMATRRCWTGLAPMAALSTSEEDGFLGPGLCAWQLGPWSMLPHIPCGRTGMAACHGSVTTRARRASR